MIWQTLLLILSLLRPCHSALVKCNGEVLKLQLCNIQEEEYNEAIPHISPGHPTTIKPLVMIYKIAELDDRKNTISLNFLLSISWNDPRISLESSDPDKSNKWYEVKEVDKPKLFIPTLDMAGTKQRHR